MHFQRNTARGAFGRAAWPVVYVVGVVLANVITERLGLVPVIFGLVTTAGTYAAAVVLIARNLSQDSLGKRGVLTLMALGVGLSWWLASPQLAIASGVAFALSETADMAIYTPLRRKGRARAVAVASTIGAVVDTYAFLSIAGFPLSAAPGQFIVKIGMALIAAGILKAYSSLLGRPRSPTVHETERAGLIGSNDSPTSDHDPLSHDAPRR